MGRFYILAGFLFLFGGWNLNADPLWWSTGTTAFVDASASHAVSENYAPVNLGQLENVANKAATHLNLVLPSPGAGSVVDDLVSSFSTSDNYQLVNLGQLKAVAKPFYDRLRILGFDSKQNLINQGAPGWLYDTPWNPNSPVLENYAPANLGQLKWIFFI